MKVICKKTTAKGLDLTEVTNIFVDTYDYGLTLGREYLVMGIAIYKESNCLHYLTDHNGSPRWYPYMLFDVLDNRLDPRWYIDIIGKSEQGNMHTLIGFKELCNDDNFHDLLMERDDTAMRTYFERKIEMEGDHHKWI